MLDSIIRFHDISSFPVKNVHLKLRLQFKPVESRFMYTRSIFIDTSVYITLDK